ncbi:MAG TPA: hypothetical protein VEJ87_10590 [Acidimicrobiales bacterium]|nr:hypothetical protein [Acidimicrobiales bacterium]
MTFDKWWNGHAPAEARVECSGELHRVRWEEGRLSVPDHEDVEGERALAALGGDPCACVDVLDSWERHRGDLRILTISSRGAGDVFWSSGPGPTVGSYPSQVSGALFGQGGQGPFRAAGNFLRPSSSSQSFASRGHALGGTAVSSRVAGVARSRSGGPVVVGGGPVRALGSSAGTSASPAQLELEEIYSVLFLGGGLFDRLVATVVAIWANREDSGDATDHRAEMAAALSGRATLALRGWLGDPNQLVEVEMTNPSTSGELLRRDDLIIARLPFRWLSDVWTRGLSVVLGRFSLGLLEASDHRQRVTTVSPDLADVRPVTVSVDSP